jgi:hypothetical protein
LILEIKNKNTKETADVELNDVTDTTTISANIKIFNKKVRILTNTAKHFEVYGAPD